MDVPNMPGPLGDAGGVKPVVPGGPTGPGGTNETPGGEGLPWENRARIGMANALIGTIKGVLMEPKDTFKIMKQAGGVGEPLLYAVILGTVGGIASLVWQALFSAIGPLLGAGEAMNQFAETMIGLGILAVLMPAFVVIGLFISAAITHLFAMMFGAADNGFEVTFRVVSYTNGSTAILNIIPIIGGLAALVWTLVASIIGLAEAQNTTGGRAAGAVLTPLVLCCVCIIAFVVLAIVGIAAGADGFNLQ